MDFVQALVKIWQTTGLYTMVWQQAVMIAVCCFLLWLGIKKQFEPLLLVPIAFGGILANIPMPPGEMIAEANGFLGIVFNAGINTGLFPLFIFMAVGAMTDFGPLIANPKMALLGGAAQFGIFATLLGAIGLSYVTFGDAHPFAFGLKEAASMGIIGGADGPTSIYLTSRLAPDLLGAIAVAAYSYMALVPIIQPPIMKILTTKEERAIKMDQLKPVTKNQKILFPIVVTLLCVLLLPSAAPLIGMLMLGNLFKESGVVERLSKTAQNDLMNIITIFLGVTVGATANADTFLQPKTLLIICLGLIAFSFGTAGGVLFAKVMNLFSKKKINPLIGSAGVSAVPMAARVSQKVGQQENPDNFLLMHAMGANEAGVKGPAVSAGVLLSLFGLNTRENRARNRAVFCERNAL